MKTKAIALLLNICFVSVMLVPAVTPVAHADSAIVVLQDDFNDGSFDLEEWWVDTTHVNSALIERFPEGDIESLNRGYLNSVGQWKPGASEVGTLSVTGRFRLPNEGTEMGDIANICTRASGVTRPEPPTGPTGGVCQECIEFGVTRQDFGFGLLLWMDLHLAPDQDFTLAYKPFVVGPDWYWFKIEDDGYNIRAWVNPTGDFSGDPDLEATSDHEFDVNHVAFYGRPYQRNLDHITYFDDITISIMPPPVGFPTLSQWGLIALGLLLAGSLTFMICRRFGAKPAGA